MTDVEAVNEEGAVPLVQPEQVANTALLIRTSDNQYPLLVYQVVQFLRSTGVSLPDLPYIQDLKNLGYEVVYPTESGQGDVVEEGRPVLNGDRWEQTWNIREFSETELAIRLAAAKEAANVRINEVRDRDFEKGIPYKLTEDGEVFHIQIRADDKSNLILLNMMALQRENDENPEPIEFRPYENTSVLMTPKQTVDMTSVALQAGPELYKAIWAMKDRVKAATTIEEVPEIPNTFVTVWL